MIFLIGDGSFRKKNRPQSAVITNKNNENKKHSKIKGILLCFFGRNLLFRKEMIK